MSVANASEMPGRQYADVGDFKVAYREWGSPDDPAVMLLHGIPMNSVLFSKVGPLLAAQGYHVFAPGQLGLSYTDGPLDADHSLKGQADIMTAFAEQVIQAPFILFGHDLGGGIAQIMVTDPELQQRNDVTKVVIGNSAVLDLWPVPKANAAIALANEPDADTIFTPDTVREMVKTFSSAGLLAPEETLTDEILDDLYGNYADNDSTRRHFIEYLKAMDNSLTVDASPKMVMWNRPAMLLWGVHDPFQPPYVSGVALARIMPHATWEHLDASHYYPLERPQEVVDAFVRWDRD
ncbi:alpha/beta fold hydrolase [Halomonas sp. V046]|uniref:alpha/beta fold hydrolase n=1 Tax=Halomonas sp. V046 TaxID=3459611 RepID=UPI0040446A8A